MTIDKFQEFQKYITDTDFSVDGVNEYKLYIVYYHFTERECEESVRYEDNDFKQVITDYIPDEDIEDIYSLRIICNDYIDEIEFSDTLEIMKKRYAENEL